MRWSWQVAVVAGIPVRVHATFALLLVWIFGAHLAAGEGIPQAATGVGLILAIVGVLLNALIAWLRR